MNHKTFGNMGHPTWGVTYITRLLLAHAHNVIIVSFIWPAQIRVLEGKLWKEATFLFPRFEIFQWNMVEFSSKILLLFKGRISDLNRLLGDWIWCGFEDRLKAKV